MSLDLLGEVDSSDKTFSLSPLTYLQAPSLSTNISSPLLHLGLGLTLLFSRSCGGHSGPFPAPTPLQLLSWESSITSSVLLWTLTYLPWGLELSTL